MRNKDSILVRDSFVNDGLKNYMAESRGPKLSANKPRFGDVNLI